MAETGEEPGAAGEAGFCAMVEGVFPELGRHACHVAGSYVVTALVMGILIWLSLSANRRARRALEALERERRERHDGQSRNTGDGAEA